MQSRLAFLFPGQGSQAVGMGADVAEQYSDAADVYEAADSALGFSLSGLCFHGPEETLKQTINAQPAIVCTSLALLAALQQEASKADPYRKGWISPIRPNFVAGHSVGEYSAFVASGALTLSQAIQVVRERGRLMHAQGETCPGSMAAIIGLDEQVLDKICADISSLFPVQMGAHPGYGKVAVANLNCPGQTVISGAEEALAKAMTAAKEQGARLVKPLAVSGAFHSPVMQPACSELDIYLEEYQFANPQIPIISNITAQPLHEASQLKEEMVRQIVSSVDWTESIEYMTENGVTTFIEIGPGQVLSGLVKRISKDAHIHSISTAHDIPAVLDALSSTV